MEINVYSIVDKVIQAQNKSIIVRWAVPGEPPLTGNDKAKQECWTITIANDPDEYFQTLDKKYKGKATHSFKFEISSIEEGVQLCKDLYKHFGSEEEEAIIVSPKVDATKPLFFAIHIHYHFI